MRLSLKSVCPGTITSRVAGVFILALLLAVGVGQRAAHAQLGVESHTATIPSTLTDYTQLLSLTKFDPNVPYLGVGGRQLVGVRLTISINVDTTLTVHNNSASNISGNVRTEVYGAIYDPAGVLPNPAYDNTNLPVDGAFFADALTAAQGFSLTANGTPNDTATLPTKTASANAAQVWKIAGYGGAGMPTPQTTNDTFVNQFVKQNAGDTNINLTANAHAFTVLSVSGGNVTASQATNADFNVTVDYYFQPVPAPPAVTSLGIGGVMGMAQLGMVRLRRRRRNVSEDSDNNEA